VNIKTTLKSSVAAAALFAIAAPVAPSVNAADDTLKSGNKNSLKISGYVSRSVFYADDSESEQLFQSDGGVSTTRVRWIANGTVNETVTAGAMIEMSLPQSNAQGSLSLAGAATGPAGATDSASASTWGIRHQFVWVKHKKMGKISLGRTNAASNGRSEVTFSAVNMIDDSSASNFGDGINFIDTTGATPSISTITVGAAYTNIDGRGRNDVIRYDSPRFAGLTVAVSALEGGDWDIGADYRMKTGPVKIRIGAQHNNNASTSVTVGGSTSISMAALHDSGVNGTFAYGQQHLIETPGRGSDPRFIYFNVGYRAKIFGVGGTNFSFSLNQTDDLQANNSEGTAIGLTVAQLFDPIGSNIGLSYKNYSFDSNTNNFEDVDVITLQTIFNF
jgi:predicted porin